MKGHRTTQSHRLGFAKEWPILHGQLPGKALNIDKVAEGHPFIFSGVGAGMQEGMALAEGD